MLRFTSYVSRYIIVFMQNHPLARDDFLEERGESTATVINSALTCLRD